MNSCVGAENRLIALSQGTTVVSAAREWRHEGICQNYESALAACDFCSDQALRFTFLIQNTVTGHKAWVGDKCLLALRIPIYSNGERIPDHRARQHLAAQVQCLVTSQAITACTVLALEKRDVLLADAIIQYRNHGRVTIHEASLIFSGIEQCRMLTNDVVLPIYTQRDEDIEQLRSIPSWALWRFWHCLTPEQVKLALCCGHTKPDVLHGELVRYQRETDRSLPLLRITKPGLPDQA